MKTIIWGAIMACFSAHALAQTKPAITLETDGRTITESVKEQAKETVKEKVEDVKNKLMAEAQQQAQQIRDAAKAAADKVKEEGYAQADNLVRQAPNPIAKIAAQRATDYLS